MPPVGFEPTVSAGERSQTYAVDRAATGTATGRYWCLGYHKLVEPSIACCGTSYKQTHFPMYSITSRARTIC